MRILLASPHRYPAFGTRGSGLHPRTYPSGSGFWIHDMLMQGLTELGHEVCYFLADGAALPWRRGAKYAPNTVWDPKILPRISDHFPNLPREWEASGRQWVAPCHIDMR